MSEVNQIPGPILVPSCACEGSRWVPIGSPCLCQPTERMLRAYAADESGILPALNHAQREWCLAEIARVEGHSREEHLEDTDRWLAHGVLTAWTDFCRDKGLM